MSPADKIVLDTLVSAARDDKLCPTNTELAALVGWQAGQTAGDALRRLERNSHITVSRIQNGRMIQITATGQQVRSRTFAEAERTKVVIQPAEVVQILPPVVFRDPCPMCGVRGDHGCSHGWTGEYFARAAA